MFFLFPLSCFPNLNYEGAHGQLRGTQHLNSAGAAKPQSAAKSCYTTVTKME
jgi:hypothetical protein